MAPGTHVQAGVVTDVWNIDEGKSLQIKIAQCVASLYQWGQEITCSFKCRIKESKRILKTLKGRRDEESVERYVNEVKKLSEIYIQQETFWKQMSKQLWLKEGDRNSKYFHASSRKRRKLNLISKLQNKEGQIVDWDHGLQDTMTEYFDNLFQSSNTDWEDVLNCMSQRISASQNEELLRPVDDKEVKAALYNMHPDKSPGPDGMSPAFYQKFWCIVGKDVVQLVKDFFNTCRLPDKLADTNIVLVPKKKNLMAMQDLRPISLCNVVYKICSKVLANIMKGVIDNVISDTQSAFISGRLITDNIIISYEVMHYMKRKAQGKSRWMALKLDISKAYDRVEWNFLKAALSKLGFNIRLVNLFMECVSSARYQISHAGREFGHILPQRGLRQGGPLSSYLFLICIEGLTAIIRNYEQRKIFKGIQVARGAPVISHMFFADDTYVYCRANNDAACRVQEILNKFEIASGQKINAEKSSVFYSCNTDDQTKNEVKSVLGFNEADEDTTYLGLPNTMMRKKTAVLGDKKKGIHQKSWEKLSKRKGEGGLGFRQIHAFNIALLGKQGWRLICYPESLANRLYKARYYPRDPYVHTRSEAIERSTVSSLMNSNNQWNINLILDTFNDREANLILGIPIQHSTEDSWYWRREKLGNYSIKSAYSLLQDYRGEAHASDNSGFWRSLWNLKIPVKVKHFLWSAASDCLPTKYRLKEKRVMVNDLCPVCNTENESIFHVLVTCSFASACFISINKVVIETNINSFANWLKDVFNQYKGMDVQRMVMLCWAVWKCRNHLVWNQRGMEVAEAVVLAKSSLNQWLSAQNKLFDTSLGYLTQVDGDERWKVPDDNTIKINTDAAIFEASKCFSYSRVARNHAVNGVAYILQGNQVICFDLSCEIIRKMQLPGEIDSVDHSIMEEHGESVALIGSTPRNSNTGNGVAMWVLRHTENSYTWEARFDRELEEVVSCSPSLIPDFIS
ncbi:uncharacterized protein LOC141720107 [Apium graveolens]|uniref:uncharacterized protein LOC141720107 n=1 Tax=Apium graveolens TaxID=4045 RepID=UPI003D7B829D